jgi:hypothetical protein
LGHNQASFEKLYIVILKNINLLSVCFSFLLKFLSGELYGFSKELVRADKIEKESLWIFLKKIAII